MVTAPPADDMQLILSRAEQIQDAGYAQFVCQRSYRYYAERVKQLGFANLGVVADVGCGYGQWSAALAEVNEAVIGLDLHHGRLGIGRAFADSLNLKNVDFARANGLKLPLADESVDGLFCYGVFMFMDRRLALDEFRRVLKPGGKLYVCTNGLGWWLQLWIKHLRGNEHVRRSAWQAMVRGKQNTPPHSTSRRQVAAMLGAEQWGEIVADYEGCLGCKDRIRPEPFYQGSYWGCDSVIEFTAIRKSHTQAEVRQSLEAEIAPALQDSAYNYHTPLQRYPQPSPATDLVNNCDQG
ncbi:MAG: class I SAM-dependent methyltransferase, partial [Planctomycetaceae bacterium]|nr:class I SAM-dependent methyltransferase [Planctomycetaceae bacterium]